MLTDRELMARVASGDEEAFNVLFERHAAVVRGRALSIVRVESAAEDVTQEVFLRLWSRAGQWQGKGTVRGWLLRAATNLALNHLRSVRRRRSQPLEIRPEPEGDDDGTLTPSWMIDNAAAVPDQVLEQSEHRRARESLISRLPVKQREVIRLVHEMEMNVEEAARDLGVPPGTIKSRLYHARHLLAREWERRREHYE